MVKLYLITNRQSAIHVTEATCFTEQSCYRLAGNCAEPLLYKTSAGFIEYVYINNINIYYYM